MRWTLEPLSDIGDMRIVRRFLFIPKELNREIRWLEFAYIVMAFESQYMENARWVPLHWSTQEEYNKYPGGHVICQGKVTVKPVQP